MRKRTKDLINVYDDKKYSNNSYKIFEKQKYIKENYYFNGCLTCQSKTYPINIFNDIRIKIISDKLIIENKSNRKTLIQTQINFCPFCGKQLNNELSKYID